MQLLRVLFSIHGMSVYVGLVVVEDDVAAWAEDVPLEALVSLQKGFAYLEMLIKVAVVLFIAARVFIPLFAVPAFLLVMHTRDLRGSLGSFWCGASLWELEECEVQILVRQLGIHHIVAA